MIAILAIPKTQTKKEVMKVDERDLIKQGYKKVTVSPAWDWESDGRLFKGIYVGSESDVGPNNSMIYHFKTPSGKLSVWGSTVLDTKMKQTELGTSVVIHYLGVKTNETSGRTYKDFEVYSKPATESEEEAYKKALQLQEP